MCRVVANGVAVIGSSGRAVLIIVSISYRGRWPNGFCVLIGKARHPEHACWVDDESEPLPNQCNGRSLVCCVG
jgi:hypothetical protein